jgi:tagatose-1,6-bisphosphate aldolase non-catalytic subunit AgaZ/GatZ
MFQADVNCLAAVAILTGATSGQALVVEDLLIDATLDRRRRDGTTTGLHEEDVRKVVREVYERAGATGSVWPGMVSTYFNL